MKRAAGFSVLLLLLAGGLLVTTFGLSPLARLAPLWVLVPTTLLALVQIARDALAEPEDAAGSGGPWDLASSSSPGGGQARDPASGGRAREVRGLAWVFALMALVYLIGIFAATALFLAPFLRLEAGMRWRASLPTTAAVIACLYLVFGVLVDVPFPEAMLP